MTDRFREKSTVNLFHRLGSEAALWGLYVISIFIGFGISIFILERLLSNVNIAKRLFCDTKQIWFSVAGRLNVERLNSISSSCSLFSLEHKDS